MVSQTVSFADGDTANKTISIPIINDTTAEANETVNLTLSNPTGGATLGTPSAAVLTITDNDVAPAPGTLQFSAATYSVGENAGNAAVIVTRTGGSSGAVSVSFATSNGTATAPGDYTAVSQTVSFADGDTANKTISIPIINDTTAEANETVNLTLSNPTGGATLGTPSTAVLTITDNDVAPAPGTLQFSAATYSVGENAGNAAVIVTRTGGSSGAVSVSFATSNGTATAPGDYTAVSQTVSFANGDTANKTISIPIINDTTVEANETVNLTLSSPTGGATLGTPSTAVLTITDNDVAPAGTISREVWMAISGNTVADIPVGGAPNLTDMLPSFETATDWADNYGTRMRGYITAPVTGNYIFWIAGDNNSELWLSSDENPGNKANIAQVPEWTNSREWNKYSTQKSATRPLTQGQRYYVEALQKEGTGGDNLAVGWAKPGESISAPSEVIPGSVLSPFGPVTGGTLQFSAASYSVGENAGNAAVIVTRTGGSSGAVSVSFATSNGTATAPGDYTAVSQTVSFANGDTANKTISIPIINDTTAEANETVNLTLSNPTGGATLGTPSTAVLTITDNDVAPAPGTLQFSAATYSVGENAGNAAVIVTRTGGSSGAVSVSFATSNGTATAPGDYTVVSQTVSFANGDTANKTISIPIINDTTAEANETVNLTLSSPTGGATLGTPSTAVLTITDNDVAPAGTISREVWMAISGNTVADIPVGGAPNLTDMLPSFETATDWADNYGTRMRGYITAPVTGNYIFWIAGDNNSELWLSSDENPGNKANIAQVPEWTNSREWNKYSTQKSATRPLTQGQRYYVEALQKEGTGGDNLAVGWAKPGESISAPSEVIPGSVLSPFSGGGQ